jgi:hypothetical protein
MIGKVFYNMLATIGHKERDERMIELSASVRDMLETRSYDDLMGSKVPHFKADVLNLLKVVDMSENDRAELARLGFSELLSGQKLKLGGTKDEAYSIEREKEDKLQASTISVSIVQYETSLTAHASLIPRRFYI